MNNENNPFKITGNTEAEPQYGQGMEKDTPATQVDSKIKELVASADIFIFMKGTPQFPQCGFSANTVGIFGELGKQFKTFDVLSDPAVRQGIKSFSNWPTIPQIFIKGKFVGGNDIITEMHQAGDLQGIVAELA